jgi:hypothetical protein
MWSQPWRDRQLAWRTFSLTSPCLESEVQNCTLWACVTKRATSVRLASHIQALWKQSTELYTMSLHHKQCYISAYDCFLRVHLRLVSSWKYIKWSDQHCIDTRLLRGHLMLNTLHHRWYAVTVYFCRETWPSHLVSHRSIYLVLFIHIDKTLALRAYRLCIIALLLCCKNLIWVSFVSVRSHILHRTLPDLLR